MLPAAIAAMQNPLLHLFAVNILVGGINVVDVHIRLLADYIFATANVRLVLRVPVISIAKLGPWVACCRIANKKAA